jgi:hypothetical protein
MLRLLILLAVLFTPLAMQPAAAAPVAHHAASMPMQHCPEQAPDHRAKGAFGECTTACSAALPAMDAPRAPPALFVSAPIEAVPPQRLHGLHPETATPPPKLS